MITSYGTASTEHIVENREATNERTPRVEQKDQRRMVYEASALRKRTMEEASSTSALLEYMGFHGENQDPSTAEANWRHVERRLNTHPHEARALWGISYPLNLALSNSTTPVPACVVKLMIGCYPEACNDEDFGNACRYAHTTGDVLRVLLDAKPGIPSKEFIKRWDLDWIACNNNRDVAKVLILNCEAAKPSCIKEWKEMRPSSVSLASSSSSQETCCYLLFHNP